MKTRMLARKAEREMNKAYKLGMEWGGDFLRQLRDELRAFKVDVDKDDSDTRSPSEIHRARCYTHVCNILHTTESTKEAIAKSIDSTVGILEDAAKKRGELQEGQREMCVVSYRPYRYECELKVCGISKAEFWLMKAAGATRKTLLPCAATAAMAWLACENWPAIAHAATSATNHIVDIAVAAKAYLAKNIREIATVAAGFVIFMTIIVGGRSRPEQEMSDSELLFAAVHDMRVGMERALREQDRKCEESVEAWRVVHMFKYLIPAEEMKAKVLKAAEEMLATVNMIEAAVKEQLQPARKI